METAARPERTRTDRSPVRVPAAAPSLVPLPSLTSAEPVVALLCPERRLRRILWLSLTADHQRVVEWERAEAAPGVSIAAAVADLDSLACDVPELLRRLRAGAVAEHVALLLISIYPLDLHRLDRAGPADALQPPFSPQALAFRVRRLLAGSP